MKRLNVVFKIGVLVLFTVVVFSSCLKTEDPFAAYTPEREAGLIKDWLTSMVASKKNIDTTSTGLYFVVEKGGNGSNIQVGDTVTVKFTGTYVDGTIFDASAYYTGGTLTFIYKDTDPNKQMIQGWEEAIAVMKMGERAVFLIPSVKAYGAIGNERIPPNSPLIFIIEVVDIK